MNASVLSTKVLLTGATGFIGLHTALRLLQLGYSVRATVRSAAQGRHICETLSKHLDVSRLELAFTDLMKDEGWQESMAGCDFVIHTASPYPATNPKDEMELIIPAREGTLRILRAAVAGNIKRVVFLSSIGAIFDGHQGENRTFDESGWSDLEKTRLTYHTSKTLAERAAWDFIQGPENTSEMEMVAINASNVFGPVLDKHLFTSAEWFRTLMRAEVPGVPRVQLDFVDVRDLADVLVKAFSVPEAAGLRIVCNGASISIPEFANILHQNFSARGYRVPTRILPDALFRLVALLVPKAQAVARCLRWEYSYSTERAKSIFGWQPRPYKETIVDMAESLIQFGMV